MTKKNCRCSLPTEITCNHAEEDYNKVKLFKNINDGIEPEEYSRLMVMTDKNPVELWDWGLNEKVVVPTKSSDCFTIANFIRFIETRKWRK